MVAVLHNYLPRQICIERGMYSRAIQSILHIYAVACRVWHVGPTISVPGISVISYSLPPNLQPREQTKIPSLL